MQYCFLFTILAESHRKFQGLPLAFHNIIALTNRSKNWGEVSANCCVHKRPLGHLKVMWDVGQFFVFLTCSVTWPVLVLSWVYASSISRKHFQNTLWGTVPSQLRITILEPSSILGSQNLVSSFFPKRTEGGSNWLGNQHYGHINTCCELTTLNFALTQSVPQATRPIWKLNLFPGSLCMFSALACQMVPISS